MLSDFIKIVSSKPIFEFSIMGICVSFVYGSGFEIFII